MFCPSDVNTGFIELVGPILQNDLNSIAVKSYPLSISFAPRTTPPSLIGNRLDESTENTCTYKGKRFTLVDVQICSVTNKGYILPGMTSQPVAEMILSFSSNGSTSELSSLSGVLMCLPIYDSGNSSYSDYLNQVIDPNIPTCKYTSESGTLYNGMAAVQLNDQTLSACISAACNNPKILSYTYSNGTCWLFDNIPPINKVKDTSIISGTVNHNIANVSCDISKTQNTNGDNTEKLSKNLESLFYSKNTNTIQSSIAYKTCFETIDSNNIPNSKSLYVVVFPNGIHLTQSGFQQLLTQLNNNLPPYMIPPAIRGGDATLRSYKFDNEGEKVPTITSTDGIIYSTPISSCTDEFRHRFEYFTLPPRLPATSSNVTSEKCPYYKTTQYKCVPFNQLKDLSGQYVIPGNKTLDTILYEQQQTQEKENKLNVSSEGLTTEQVEGIVAGIAGFIIVGGLCLWAGSKISKYA